MVSCSVGKYVCFSYQVAEAQRLAGTTTQWNVSSFTEEAKDDWSYNIRRSLQGKGIPEDIAGFISTSWSDGTRKQYSCAWRKWYLWNHIRFSSPFQTSESVVLNYLYFLFMSGKSYSVINLHKSVLLQTLPFFGNSWCSDSKLIIRFMKSVSIHKPARPKYIMTWDVSVVLSYLQTLMPLSQLSLKLLTLKALALVALATAPRAQTVKGLDLNNMVVQQQAVVFYFCDILKTSTLKKGNSFSLKIEHFSDERLCAMHTLLYYVKRTKLL